MSNPGETDATPITGIDQLAAYMAEGSKSPRDFRIGTEHEKFGFRRSDLGVPPYEGPGGIREVLEGIEANGWEPIQDTGKTIGLKRDGASVSLEPAGQLELSGAPLASLHETRDEMAAHFAEIRPISERLGLGFAPLGFHPLASREQMPWMPKSRYAIMRRYMPTVGSLGLDMMLRTCTVQVNLDFSSEADMVRKMRVSMALQPLATALFANSPFVEGKPSGLMSSRAHAWTDTDNNRSGILPCVFEPGFGFARYVEWLLDVPMYFIARDEKLIDVAGESFRRFMAGDLPGHPGEQASMGDYADHLTTAFPDVRLKKFIEMRGADAGTPAMMLAQSALWVGLLYDDAALSAAVALVDEIGWQKLAALRPVVPREGMGAILNGSPLRVLAREVVAIAQQGLRARGLRDAVGADESAYLDPLAEIAAGGPTQAEHWLARYHGAWQGDVRHILAEAAI